MQLGFGATKPDEFIGRTWKASLKRTTQHHSFVLAAVVMI